MYSSPLPFCRFSVWAEFRCSQQKPVDLLMIKCILYGMVEDADPEKSEKGVAKGIAPSGALLVETEAGLKEVLSGEVSVRGVYGYV